MSIFPPSKVLNITIRLLKADQSHMFVCCSLDLPNINLAYARAYNQKNVDSSNKLKKQTFIHRVLLFIFI